MNRILVFVEHKENRRLLAEVLSRRHEVLTTENPEDIQKPFDCGIFDGIALSRCAELLRIRRKVSEPYYLPVLLMTTRQDLRLAPGLLWQVTDDLIFTPIEKAELLARVEVLLCAREFSLRLGAANGQLEQQLIDTTELHQITRAISEQTSPEAAFEALMASTRLRFVRRASLQIFNPDLPRAVPEARIVVAHRASGVCQMDGEHEADGYIAAFVSSSELVDVPILIENVALDPRLGEDARRQLLDEGTHSVFLSALIARGEWYGVIEFRAAEANAWNTEDSRHIGQLVDRLAVSLDNLQLMAKEVEARRLAERADRSKIQFLGMISHELRTPLASIKGYSSTLLADDISFDSDTQHEFLQVIDSEADKLNELVGQLLDLSRLQAGALRISPMPHRVGDILVEARAQLDVLVGKHHFQVDVSDDLPLVNIDQARMAQVLTNLVGNAVKYSAAGTSIHVTAYARPAEVVISVADQGIGIPPEDRAIVFEAFRQVERKDIRSSPGAGLGLAICRGLVEAHGGRIWIEEHPGPGTTVAFTIPVLLT